MANATDDLDMGAYDAKELGNRARRGRKQRAMAALRRKFKGGPADKDAVKRMVLDDDD